MPETRAILPLVLFSTIAGGSSAVGRSVLLAMGKVKPFTAAVLIAGHRPVPGALYWRPDPAEAQLATDGKRFFWREVPEYTVVRCPPVAVSLAAVSPPAG